MHLRALILTALALYAPLTSAVSSVENTIGIRVNTGGNSAAPGERVETGDTSVSLDLTTRVHGQTVERVEEHASSSIVYQSTTSVVSNNATVERVLTRDEAPVLSETRSQPMTPIQSDTATASEPLPDITKSTTAATSTHGEGALEKELLFETIAHRIVEVVLRTAKHLYELFT